MENQFHHVIGYYCIRGVISLCTSTSLQHCVLRILSAPVENLREFNLVNRWNISELGNKLISYFVSYLLTPPVVDQNVNKEEGRGQTNPR